MKTFLKTFMSAIARLAASESGEFLSTRRKAHLLYGDIYTRMSNETGTERRQSIAQLAAPAEGKFLSTRREAHRLLGNIYTQLDLAVKTERRQPSTAFARRYYKLFGEQMTSTAG
jgi:hypothetical protein